MGGYGYGSKEYREGYRAYEENYPLANPYINGTWQAQEFYVGYAQAKADLRGQQSEDGEE